MQCLLKSSTLRQPATLQLAHTLLQVLSSRGWGLGLQGQGSEEAEDVLPLAPQEMDWSEQLRLEKVSKPLVELLQWTAGTKAITIKAFVPDAAGLPARLHWLPALVADLCSNLAAALLPAQWTSSLAREGAEAVVFVARACAGEER